MNIKKRLNLVRVVLLLAIFISLLSCGSEGDTDEHEIITSPFFKRDCLFYEVTVDYYDSTERFIFTNSVSSDDNINDWMSHLKKAYIDFDDIIDEIYEVGSAPDEVREKLIELEMWDIGEEYSSFIITESLIISLDD